MFYVIKVSVSVSVSWYFVISVSVSESVTYKSQSQSQYGNSWIPGLSLNIDIEKPAPQVSVSVSNLEIWYCLSLSHSAAANSEMAKNIMNKSFRTAMWMPSSRASIVTQYVRSFLLWLPFQSGWIRLKATKEIWTGTSNISGEGYFKALWIWWPSWIAMVF